ncbi:hypothetical protein, partial [Acinetobacter baumannii]
MFKRNSIKILSSLAVAGVLLTACSKSKHPANTALPSDPISLNL